MSNHPLIRLARRTEIPPHATAPPGARYDFVRGAWVDTQTGRLLVRSDQDRPRPQTKKMDVETGEDQKGY